MTIPYSFVHNSLELICSRHAECFENGKQKSSRMLSLEMHGWFYQGSHHQNAYRNAEVNANFINFQMETLSRIEVKVMYAILKRIRLHFPYVLRLLGGSL